MIAWLRRVLADARPEPMLSELLPAFRAQCADLPPPRVIYATPERDELKPGCVHCYGENDMLALELAEAATRPANVVRMQTRVGRS